MALLVLAVDADEIEAASDWLFSLGATAIEERTDALVAGFADDDAALAARSVVGERWPTRFEDDPDEAGWRDVWLEHLTPIKVGPVVVHPPWSAPTDDLLADAPHAISIDPGRAFGSGHHPSTQLAILALGRVIHSGDAVLDVGCGTGVLSIAAAALGAGSVTGIDLDHDIIEVAQANADANDMAGTIHVDTTPIEVVTGSFDTVVANLTAGEMAPLLDDIARLSDRAVVLSGLLVTQRERVEGALGRTADAVFADGDWQALAFDEPRP